jgi:hypothetical protein
VTAVGDAIDVASLSEDYGYNVVPTSDFVSSFTGGPKHGVLSVLALTAEADGFGSITGYGNFATLYDSAGDDQFVGDSGSGGTLWGPGYSVTALVRQLRVIASTGNDVAYLSGQNLYTQPGYAHSYYPTTEFFYGLDPIGDRSTEVFGFGTVRVTGTSQGGADLYDSVGDDIFVATPTYSYLAGTGYLVVASGFGRVSGYSTAGHDAAYFFDSPGDDLFRATPSTAFLAGSGFLNGATGFFRVFAYAGAGGNDLAEVYDSAGNDVFQGQSTDGVLLGVGYEVTVRRFGRVRAFATAGGYDLLYLGVVTYIFEQYGTWN